MDTLLCNCLNNLLSDDIILSLRICKMFWLAWLKIANEPVVLVFNDISVARLRGCAGLMLTKVFRICVRLTDVFRINFYCFWSFTSWDFAWSETCVKISRFILEISRKLRFSGAFTLSYIFSIFSETILVCQTLCMAWERLLVIGCLLVCFKKTFFMA